MFEINSKKTDLWKQNICKTKNISLNKNLDCFIVINSNDEKFIDLTIRNILDYIIDKISIENTYKEFSIALENINSFIKTWRLDSKNDIKIDIFIWILNKDNFMFSNMWECSCYLIKEDNEVIELINKKDNKKEFSFISNWELKENEIIFVSNNRVLDYLSNNDLIDWLNHKRDLESFNENIDNILKKEIVDENICYTSLKYNPIVYSEEIIEYKRSNFLTKTKLFIKKLKEHKNSKKLKNIIESNKTKIKAKYNNSPKKIKNIIIILWIIISIILMYKILFNVVNISTQNSQKEEAITELQQAKQYVQIASENVINTEIFETNIEEAQNIIESIKNQNLFLDDINKLNEDISILKKQFNKIEVFSNQEDYLVYSWELEDSVKIVKANQKPYIISKKWVIWPILPSVEAKTYSFNSLETNEYFVDATTIWDDIILLTNYSKIVRFTSNWYFEFSDVSNQTTWEKSKEIESYGQNIYLLWKEDNQIFKHTKVEQVLQVQIDI